jgi:hypothetical protein
VVPPLKVTAELELVNGVSTPNTLSPEPLFKATLVTTSERSIDVVPKHSQT